MEIEAHDEPKTRLDRLLSFEEKLDSAEAEGVVTGLPADQDRFRKIRLDRDLLPVVWDRLYRLGYLNRESPYRSHRPGSRPVHHTGVDVRRKLGRAVKCLQEEAGLTVDGWLGLYTWDALQDLFTFESPFNLERWREPKASRFLRRAVELRLAALGIIERGKVRVQQRHIERDLVQWKQVLTDLEVSGLSFPVTDDQAMQWLFDTDRLTKAVAGRIDGKARDQIPDSITPVFLKSLLRTELWLYGYEAVNPGRIDEDDPRYFNTISFSPAILMASSRANVRVGPASAAVTGLLHEIGEGGGSGSVAKYSRASEYVLVRESLTLLATLEDDRFDRLTAREKSKLLSEEIDKLSGEEQAQLNTEIQKPRGIGARIYDGIKRAFAWLVRLAAGGIRWVRSKIVWLAQAVKKVATYSASFVRRAFQVLGDGYGFLASRLFLGSSNHFAIYRELDFDFRVFISGDATEESIRPLQQAFNTAVIRTRAAFVICMWVVEAIVMSLKVAAGSVLGVIAVLHRLYSISDSDEVELIRAAYASYDVAKVAP